jgi:hypothetical protein
LIRKARRSLYIPLPIAFLGVRHATSTCYTPPTPITCKHTTKSTKRSKDATLTFRITNSRPTSKRNLFMSLIPTIITKYSYSPAEANPKARCWDAQISSKSSCSIFLPSPLRRSKRTVSFRDGLLLLIAMACRPDSLDSRNSRSRSLPTSRACVEAALVMRAIGPQRLRVKVT